MFWFRGHIALLMSGEEGEHPMSNVRPDSADTEGLLEEFAQGDGQALDRLLTRHRDELRDFIEARLDPRVAARVDPSDVVQEAQMEVARRMDEFLRRRPMPFRLWVRKTAYERLLDLHKRHLKRSKRSVQREVALPEHSSLMLARPLLQASTPSQHLEARELAERVARVVATLSELDRDILLLRHAEGMPFEDIACLLDVEPAAARKRFGRALIRLQQGLSEQGLSGLRQSRTGRVVAEDLSPPGGHGSVRGGRPD
jgi:RNA polymerase sigma-70 factor (ECF subfamily)